MGASCPWDLSTAPNPQAPAGAEAGVNEQFTSKKSYVSNNWTYEAGASQTMLGEFGDNVCRFGAWVPQPLTPQSPLSTQLVATIPQVWFAGSSQIPPPNYGCEVQTDTIASFIDHARHIEIVSPVSQAAIDSEASRAGSLTSNPTPVLNLRQLAEQSAVIVKGRVLEVHTIGVVKNTETSSFIRQLIASFQVDDVLKGKPETVARTVEFDENPDVSGTTLEQIEYAMLFLTREQNGAYGFVKPQLGKMPITSETVASAATAQTTAEKPEAELIASVSDPDRMVARTALGASGEPRNHRFHPADPGQCELR